MQYYRFIYFWREDDAGLQTQLKEAPAKAGLSIRTISDDARGTETINHRGASVVAGERSRADPPRVFFQKSRAPCASAGSSLCVKVCLRLRRDVRTTCRPSPVCSRRRLVNGEALMGADASAPETRAVPDENVGPTVCRQSKFRSG